MPFVRKYFPRWIVVENVTGMKRWEGYSELKEQLSDHYHLRIQVLDAADFGVPQTRKRLFIVGDRLQRPPEIRGNGTRRTAADLLDLPGRWQSRPLSDGHLSENTLARIKRGMEALGKGRDFLVVYYSSDRAGGWQSLDRPIRTLTTLDRFGLLRWEDGRPTFRMLQVPELRRAMGYPDEARLEIGSRRDKVKLLGNGVCPPVMQAVIEQLTSRPSAKNKAAHSAAAAGA
jgi:DNA (cytosine-5)-methyltransferase 1